MKTLLCVYSNRFQLIAPEQYIYAIKVKPISIYMVVLTARVVAYRAQIAWG